MKKIDLTGQRFGRLKVLYEIGPGKDGIEWACECECGNWTVAVTSNLRAGRTLSCGCLQKEIMATKGYKNQYTQLFNTYHNLKRACYDKSSPNYSDFGAKGICFCKEWSESVEKFKEWSLNNGYVPYAKLLRYNQDEEYSPENCFWWTPDKEKE